MRGRALSAVAAAVASAVVLLLLAGCGGDGPPPWHSLTWQSRDLPVPDGRRALVRDATWCGDRWYVVGATARGDRTRPAVWTSPDAGTWTSVALDPRGDFYAARAVLFSVACHAAHVAVLGAKTGGAHGNPRTATWHQLPDGSLAAVSAPFEQYGGPNSISVRRMAGGEGGFQIVGTWSSGAVVWSSPDGRRFVQHEAAPGLASSPAAGTQALDAAWWHDSWLVVGDSTASGARLSGTVWTGSGDGPWTPAALPGGARLAVGERVVLTRDGPLVAGQRDDAFAVWADHGSWTLTSTFGRQRADASEPDFVSGLAWTGHLVAATYSDGASFRLAVGPPEDLTDGVPLPADVDSTGDHTVTVAAHGDQLLLLADDGVRGGVWTTRAPEPSS
jgi:hypothetical protein